jgi:transcriptional regulator with XRE-family HTH domain
MVIIRRCGFVERINNLKMIRELYGATQEEIAKVINVNRATISSWENGTSRPSLTSLEKMSIYYGIGPEAFYDIELDKGRKEMIIDAGKRARNIKEYSNGERNKADEFAIMFEKVSINKTIRDYAFAMKIILASADKAELADLKTLEQIHNKLGERLKRAIKDIEEDEDKDMGLLLSSLS